MTINDQASPQAPQEAVAQMESMSAAADNRRDHDYFLYHRARYEALAQRLPQWIGPKAQVIDIGSHYLHTGGILARMGYAVTGVDVPEFQNDPRVIERAESLGVELKTVSNMESGDFLEERESCADLILFTEVLEHITFNPVRFWQRVYRLLKPGGCIYITTPNGNAFRQVKKSLKRLLLGRGQGVRVEKILDTVTYGHHWKLYTASEIRDYFAALSPDFDVSIRYYTLPRRKMRSRDYIQKVVETLPFFSEQIEAVVRLQDKTSWIAQAPDYL